MLNIPDDWLQKVDELSGVRTLRVGGFDVRVEITRDLLTRVVLPLIAILQDATQHTSERALAGLAGIPAGGKSTLAAVIQYVADDLLKPSELLVIGMDGWHYPNDVLDARSTLDEQGRPIPLRQRKGGPESYEIEAFITALRALKDDRDDLHLPVYDRRLHEPRPDALLVTPVTRIVLVEGNYVLGGTRGVPKWDTVAALLHPKFFVECDPDLARQRMIDRHIRGGSSPQEAQARYDRNDRLNAEIIQETAVRADYRIELKPERLRLSNSSQQ